MSNINLYNSDCLLAMAKMEDKQFELAIIDPPYGLDKRLSSGGGKHKLSTFRLQYVGKEWDRVPDETFFIELFRVSENQIICGANYFTLPPTRGIICWDKLQMMQTFSRWEYLWSSFDRPAATFAYRSNDDNRIHPTQKPIRLYEWLLKNYAKEGDKILDTHLGSGSSAIAADIMGYDFTGYEIDAEYFQAAKARLERHQKQGKLFG